jgi:fatty acid CoA ligase FadD36
MPQPAAIASATVRRWPRSRGRLGSRVVGRAGGEGQRHSRLGLQGRRCRRGRCAPTLHTVVAVLAGLAAGVPVVPVPPDAGPIERAHICATRCALVLGARLTGPTSSCRACRCRSSVPSDRRAPLPEPDRPRPRSSSTRRAPRVHRRAWCCRGGHSRRASTGSPMRGQWTPDDTLVHGLPLVPRARPRAGRAGSTARGQPTGAHRHARHPAAYAAAQGSLYFGVPTVWGRVVRRSRRGASALRSARLLVSGSAPLPVPVFDQLARSPAMHPIERYGMTETLITLSTRARRRASPRFRRRADRGRAHSAGRRRRRCRCWPHDGDHDRRAARPPAPRCSTATSAAARPPPRVRRPWFRTGDAAVIGPDGFHRIVGRQSSDIIKTGGFKVGAGEVETALLAHPSVVEAAVVGAPDDDLGQRIVAYVVGERVDAADLIEHVAATPVGAQATARGAGRRRAAAQRDGQGAEGPARSLTGRHHRSFRHTPGGMLRACNCPTTPLPTCCAASLASRARCVACKPCCATAASAARSWPSCRPSARRSTRWASRCSPPAWPRAWPTPTQASESGFDLEEVERLFLKLA